jgi:phenylalanyl-tRNA synthetase beta chain
VDAVRLNEARGSRDLNLFEIAQVYLPEAGRLLPQEPFVIGLASTQEVRALRGHVEALFERLRIEPKLTPAPVPGFAEGQSAEYVLGGQRIGILGVVAESVQSALDLRAPVVAAEIMLSPLVEGANLIAKAQPVPDQPAVDRDLNFDLEELVSWSELEGTIRGAAGPFLESLEFVDLYRGKQVADGRKSITSHLVYRAPDRTLTREEVDGYQQAIIAAVASHLGGRLRT